MQHTIDATDQKLGRLASQIAHILQGKLSPSYNPRLSGNDKVIVTNLSKVTITGRKATQKIYYRHTGYMGHLKERIYKEFFAKSPEKILLLAVKRMLPQNSLRDKRLRRLEIQK